jgi:adenine-specific DNA-methyltransferase
LEQLDYGENDTVIRLENVINGDETGVSKALNWKGGGSFVYAEIIQWNEKYAQKINDSKTSKDIEKIYKDMQKEAFFRYDISLEKFKEEKTQKAFTELSIADQKQVLIDCLDTNHLYVNFNDIEDSVYKVDKKDVELNKKFYK